MAFTMRTTKPEAGNKYYIRKANGGYSNAILGSPTDKDCNVLANCVGYAYGRFNEIGGYGYCKYLAPVNAENFMDYKGSCKTGNTPKVGAIMVWEGAGSLAGHVAVVEKVISDTEVYTSESGYGSSKPFWNQTRKKGTNGRWGCGSNYTFKGFIYNPAVKDEYKVVIPYEGVSDEELAARVWKGEFGNGQERKNKLGVRYAAVQALVDKGVGKSTPVAPAAPVLRKGDKVKIVGTGNGNSAGTANTAYGIGWTRVILRIWEGRAYPYQVGDGTGTTGFYKASALEKK